MGQGSKLPQISSKFSCKVADFPKSKIALPDRKLFSGMFAVHAMSNFIKVYRTKKILLDLSFGPAKFGKSGSNLTLEMFMGIHVATFHKVIGTDLWIVFTP